MPKIIKNGKEYCSTSSLGHASEILYDNSETEMTSTSVQSAITEIKNDVDTFEENLNTLISDDIDKLNKRFFISKSNVDLNEIRETGFYGVSNSDSSINLNFPAGTNGNLLVFQYSKTEGDRGRQIFFRVGTIDSNDHQWYSRQFMKTDGVVTFGAWEQIISDKVLDAALANYLPLAGGTMTGNNFYLNGGLGRVLSDANQTQIEHYGTAKDTKDRTLLRIMDSEDIKTTLRLIKYDSSTSSNTAYVYHSKNITAGTTAYTAGTTALETNCIHLVYS